MRNRNDHSVSDLFISFLLGGVIGAGIALILAPRTGKEIREKMKEFSGDLTERGKKYYGEVKEKVTSTVDKGKEPFEQRKSALSKAIEAGKGAYKKEIEAESQKE